MKTRILKMLLLVICLAASGVALAEDTKETTPEVKTPDAAAAEVKSPTPMATDTASENNLSHRPNGFAFKGGLDWGIGTGDSTGGGTQSRTMNTIELSAYPGYQIGDWAPRLLLDYGFTGQNTDPNTVGGTNLAGNGYLIGAGTTYAWRNWSFLGGVEFIGTYSESQTTTTGATSTFSAPFSFRLGGSYFFKDRWSADALIHYTQYSTNNLGGNAISISADRIRFWALALGISYQL